MELLEAFRSCASSNSGAKQKAPVLPSSCKLPHMGGMDPDEAFPCPYDKNHMVRAARFPYHLVKCRKNFPLIAREMGTCPFNARHVLPKPEMQHHIMDCPDKERIHQDIEYDLKSGAFPMSKIKDWETSSMSENWEDEMQDPRVFVWGEPNFIHGDNFSNLNKHMRKTYKQQLKKMISKEEHSSLPRLPISLPMVWNEARKEDENEKQFSLGRGKKRLSQTTTNIGNNQSIKEKVPNGLAAITACVNPYRMGGEDF
uniref:gametocyte-specific factor 1-like n=1 Tax=Myxine glutinosa TaxID=7769 RepID=UPI00358E384D